MLINSVSGIETDHERLFSRACWLVGAPLALQIVWRGSEVARVRLGMSDSVSKMVGETTGIQPDCNCGSCGFGAVWKCTCTLGLASLGLGAPRGLRRSRTACTSSLRIVGCGLRRTSESIACSGVERLLSTTTRSAYLLLACLICRQTAVVCSKGCQAPSQDRGNGGVR